MYAGTRRHSGALMTQQEGDGEDEENFFGQKGIIFTF
jgi:hypothetical protein